MPATFSSLVPLIIWLSNESQHDTLCMMVCTRFAYASACREPYRLVWQRRRPSLLLGSTCYLHLPTTLLSPEVSCLGEQPGRSCRSLVVDTLVWDREHHRIHEVGVRLVALLHPISWKLHEKLWTGLPGNGSIPGFICEPIEGGTGCPPPCGEVTPLE